MIVEPDAFVKDPRAMDCPGDITIFTPVPIVIDEVLVVPVPASDPEYAPLNVQFAPAGIDKFPVDGGSHGLAGPSPVVKAFTFDDPVNPLLLYE